MRLASSPVRLLLLLALILCLSYRLASGQAVSGADMDSTCQTKIDDLRHQIVNIRQDLARMNESLSSTGNTIETEHVAIIAKHDMDTQELRTAQNTNAGIAQDAVLKASQDRQQQFLTSVGGFLTLALGIAFKAWQDAKTNKATQATLDTLKTRKEV